MIKKNFQIERKRHLNDHKEQKEHKPSAKKGCFIFVMAFSILRLTVVSIKIALVFGKNRK